MHTRHHFLPALMTAHARCGDTSDATAQGSKPRNVLDTINKGEQCKYKEIECVTYLPSTTFNRQ